MKHPLIRHCQVCGQAVNYQIPAGDGRERAVCVACGFIHYQNPLVVVGTVPVWQGQVLLCRRAIEPRYGLWTLPAGFMELDETSANGAMRETDEESGASIELQGLLAVINVPEVSQVHLYYRARMLHANWQVGAESLEAALFTEQQIPWNELAFRSIHAALQAHFAEQKSGHHQVHEITISS